MARKKRAKPRKRRAVARPNRPRVPIWKRPFRLLYLIGMRTLTLAILTLGAAILAFTVVNPPTTFYMASEARRLGGVDHEWVDIEEMSPDVWAAAIAAEDANYCLHWGFDMTAVAAPWGTPSFI